jgi:uncharacterized protein (DUF983 family)
MVPLRNTRKICPHCNARALAPILGPKRRCKACGVYVDILDLMLRAEGAPAASVAAGR